MNNYLCRNMIYDSMDSSAALSHHGILGMHWGIRRFQPYSQGYESDNGGVYVGPKTGIGKALGGLFGKASSSAKKAGSSYAEAARMLGDVGRAYGQKAKSAAGGLFSKAKNSSIGRGVSQSISDLSKKGFSRTMQDGFSVIRDTFGPDLQKTVSSIKSKAGNATTSLGASFLSAYLGSGDLKKSKYGAGLYSIVGSQNRDGSVLERINQTSGKSSARMLSDLLSSGKTPATLSQINQGSGSKFKGFDFGIRPNEMVSEFTPYSSVLSELDKRVRGQKFDNSVRTYAKKQAIDQYNRLLGNQYYLKQLRESLI